MERDSALSHTSLRLAAEPTDSDAGAPRPMQWFSDVWLREAVRMQPVRDPLTGLYNRSYMEETLERELRRAERRYASLGVIMLDVDHFERLNETHGRAAGDALLQELSRFLIGHIRGEDIACRYGGEEIALILPDASLAGALGRAEDLRTRIRALELAHQGRPLGQVTVSMGLAVFPDHGQSGEELFRVADAALSEAKAQGRDRVVVGRRQR